MPKTQDWLDIIEKASEPKKGTKIPKNVDVYALMTMMNPPSRMKPVGNTPASWNTGAGANGIVEPEKPVALDIRSNPPSVYHEGEPVNEFPGGRKITPAGVVPAQTEQQQSDLSRMQKEKNLPGFKTGGTTYGILNDPNEIYTRPTNTFDLSPVQPYKAGVDTAFNRTMDRAAGNDPLMNNITNRALTDYDARAAVSDTQTRQGLVSNPYLTEGAKNAVTAKRQATYRGGLNTLVGDLSAQSMQRAEAANTELYNMGRTLTQDELNKQQFEKNFGEQQYGADVNLNQWQETFGFEKQKYGDQAFSRMADDAQTTDFATWIKKYPNATQADYDTAREYKARQLQSMDISNATASQNLTDLKNSAKWTNAQAFLNARDFNGYAALVKEITGRTISMAEFQKDLDYNDVLRGQTVKSGELGINSQEIANDAARFNLDTATFGSIVDAINSGALLETINQKYPTARLTQPEYDAIKEKYQMGVEADQIKLDSMKNTYGDEKYQSIIDRIGTGASLNMINEELGTNLSIDDYTAMRKASPLGEKEWEKNLSAANMLLQTQDPTNIREAAKQLGDLFPGVNFSFDQLINDIGAERFATNMTDLATLAGTFDSWAEAKVSADGLKLIDSMGISEDNARGLFQALKVNALDEEWKAIYESEFYQGLPSDKQDLIKNTLTAGVTGELEFDITPAYNVVDKSGEFVKSFDSISDANTFLGENADAEYGVKRDMNYVYKNMTTGDTVVVNNGTGTTTENAPTKVGQVSTKPVGTTYVDTADKRVYKVGAGGVIEELTIDAGLEAWTQLGSQILSSGKEENPYYNDIIDARAMSIIDGTHPVDSAITDPDLYSATLKNSTEWKPQTGVDTVTVRAGWPDEHTEKSGTFKNPPKVDSVVNYNGTAYLVKTEPKKDNDGTQHIILMDLKTGTSYNARAWTNNTIQINDINKPYGP